MSQFGDNEVQLGICGKTVACYSYFSIDLHVSLNPGRDTRLLLGPHGYLLLLYIQLYNTQRVVV